MEIDIIAELKKDNPSVSDLMLATFADALLGYVEARANIAQNGAVSLNPRTGVPLENPYTRVLSGHAKTLGRMRNINGDRVFAMLNDAGTESEDDLEDDLDAPHGGLRDTNQTL